MASSTTTGKFCMVKKDLRNKNASQISLQAGQILTAISKSPYFSVSSPFIVTLAACYETLKDTLKEDNGAVLPLAKRNDAARNTADALRNLAGYVQAISGGSEQIILSSGFSVKRSKSNIGLLPAPAIKRSIKIGQTGCIKLMWQANSLTKIYRVYISEAENPEQKKLIVSTSRSSAIVEGLEPAKRYLLFVSTVTTAGEGPLSPGITVCEAW